MVQPNSLVLVDKVLLWQKNEIGCKLRVTVECMYADNDVSKVNIIGLSTNDNLFMLKAWPFWEMLIYDLVELSCILV